jgi:hypothetical protein
VKVEENEKRSNEKSIWIRKKKDKVKGSGSVQQRAWYLNFTKVFQRDPERGDGYG